MESKGRIGRETGKEGIRRGKVADVREGDEGAVDEYDDGDPQEAMPRNTALEDWTRLVGMLEKTGSGYDESRSSCCLSDSAWPSSSDESLFDDELAAIEDLEYLRDCEWKAGFPERATAEVGVVGEWPVDEEEEQEEEESPEESESMFVLVVSANGVICKSGSRVDMLRGSAEAVDHPPSQPVLRNNDLNNGMDNEKRTIRLEMKTYSWLAMPMDEDSKKGFHCWGWLGLV
jgi:hypothetical protein